MLIAKIDQDFDLDQDFHLDYYNLNRLKVWLTSKDAWGKLNSMSVELGILCVEYSGILNVLKDF